MDDCVHRYGRALPHWRLDAGTYFVTWRLQGEQPVLTVWERELVARTVRFFAGKRYDLLAYVVMDNHVHVIVRPYADYPLERLVHAWKSYSGHQLRGGRRTPVWQREYFDRIIRNEVELDQKIQYILLNPSRRWPGVSEYPWVWCRPELGD
jgi:REP element-mobilizing transposase RayT